MRLYIKLVLLTPLVIGLLTVIYAFQYDSIPPAQVLPDFTPDMAMITEEEPPEYLPGNLPDRISLTIIGDPSTSIGIQWRTNTHVQKAVAQIAQPSPGPVDPETIREWAASSKVFGHGSYDSVHHHVAINDLAPETDYLYRIGDGQRWSEWFEFRTASTENKSFDFLFFGDLQAGIKSSWSRVVRSAWKHYPESRFMVFAGDLVDDAENDGQWNEFFSATGWLSGMVPLVATPGNHEYDRAQISTAWSAHFQFPANGPENRKALVNTSYFFDYQGVRFISINTNVMRSLRMKDMLAQRQWLKEVLENNTNEWTVVFHHHPVYSSTKDEEGKKQLQWLYASIYEEYGVDLVLQGDAHTYGRGVVNDSSDNHLQGPVYVISNSGIKMNRPDAPWATVSGSDKQLYQHISVNNDQLTYKSIAADGELFDQFVLSKSNGNKTIVDKHPLLTLDGYVVSN